MSLGENIKKYRMNKEMTRDDLAKLLDIAPTSLQNYELNSRKPNIDMLIKLSNILEVSIDVLVAGEKSIYIDRLNRAGVNLIRDISQLSTQELIEELNSRDDFPIKINIKK